MVQIQKISSTNGLLPEELLLLLISGTYAPDVEVHVIKIDVLDFRRER
jgi:hypothetical protein